MEARSAGGPTRLIALVALSLCSTFAAGNPAVFPIPREMRPAGVSVRLSEDAVIALPSPAGDADRKLARVLMAELSDRYGLAVHMEPLAQLPRGRHAIVIGTASNPLVKRLAAERRIEIGTSNPGPEGYIIDVRPDATLVAGSDDAGAFYGVQTLRQLISRAADGVRVAGVTIRDWPYKPFRGIKLYLPGRDNLPYFTRFVRDFMAANKYNKLILELNAGMRFDKHPELNAGWLDFARDMDATRRDRPNGPHGNANSAHHDTADGGVLEKSEVAAIVRLAEENHIEVIPEIPSMTHSYYLLTRHPELAEVPGQWPDTFCPSLPASYELLFDVVDEYLDVMKPKMVHMGKDEWRMPWGVCPRCSKRDYRDVFIDDLRKTYDHLAKRGVKLAIWGDHLIEPLRGAGLKERTSPSGWKYRAPGAITPEQVRKFVPRDILIFNWFWDEKYASTGQGEKDDLMLEEWGFQQVYGNMTPEVQNYGRRSARKSVIGGAPSSWAATTAFNFGKDLLFSYLGCANLLWSTSWPSHDELSRIAQSRMHEARERLSGVKPFSELDPVTPVSLTAGEATLTPDGGMRTGRITSDRIVFDVAKPVAVGVKGDKPQELPLESPAIPIGEDASSLIFLHALTGEAGSTQSYRYIYNFDDSSDLLGWYEVTYEDGFVETIPLRYQVNILEYQRMRHAGSWAYCYGADAVDLSANPEKPVSFYAFEWRNPRLGKAIREVRLKWTNGFKQGTKTIQNNGILLAGVSVVKKRPYPRPEIPRTIEAGK